MARVRRASKHPCAGETFEQAQDARVAADRHTREQLRVEQTEVYVCDEGHFHWRTVGA